MTSIFSIPAVTKSGGSQSPTKNECMLLEENKALQKQVKEGRQKIQSLAKKLSTASSDVAKSIQSVAEYDVLEAKLNKCTTERDVAISQLQASRGKNADLKEEINDLEEQVQELKKTLGSEAEVYNEKIDGLTNMLQSVSTQVTEITVAKEAMDAKLKISQDKVRQLEQECAEHARREKTLNTNLKSLSTERFDLTKKVSSLGTALDKKEKQCIELDTKVGSLAYAKQTLQRDLNASTEESKKLKETRDSLIASGAKKSKTIEAQNGRIQKLEMDKAQTHVNLTVLKHEVDMMSQIHKAALTEIEEYKTLLAQTQRNMKDREMTAQQTQAELELRLEELNKQKENLKGDVDLTVAYLQATRQEVANLRTTVQEREERIVEEKEKLAALAGSETTTVLNEDGKITVSLTDSHF